MRITNFFKERWTCITFEPQLKVIDVENPNSSLFFGKHILPGMRSDELFGSNKDYMRQAQTIAEGLEQARQEKRHVYLEYQSCSHLGETTMVTAHVEYCADGSLCLYASEIDKDDIIRVRNKSAQLSATSQPLSQEHALIDQDFTESVALPKKHEMLYHQMKTVFKLSPCRCSNLCA